MARDDDRRRGVGRLGGRPYAGQDGGGGEDSGEESPPDQDGPASAAESATQPSVERCSVSR